MVFPMKVFLVFICFLWAVKVHAQISQKCGQTPIPPNIESKIIGGSLAKPYSWPWQVLTCIFVNEEKKCTPWCGATIIGSHWIMSAGHCFGSTTNQTQTQKFRIMTGVYNKFIRNESGEVIHEVKAIYQHPLYASDYDIALIELTDSIKYDNHTQPICLPTQDSSTIIEPNTAWATGWGVKNFSTSMDSRPLRQVNVPFVNFNKCEKEYEIANLTIVEKVMICAGRTGKDTCQGDSGGPLVVKNKNNAAWFQYGITSFGYECAFEGYPGTHVGTGCDWVRLSHPASCSVPQNFKNLIEKKFRCGKNEIFLNYFFFKSTRWTLWYCLLRARKIFLSHPPAHVCPGIYSRVSSFCDFIKKTTKGAVKCQNPDTYF